MSVRRGATLTVLAWLASAAGDVPAGGPGSPEGLWLSGSGEVLWLVQAEGGRYDVVAKRLNQPWEWVGEELAGTPRAMAATGSRLRMLLSPRGALTFSTSKPKRVVARTPDDPNWPDGAPPLAACGATGLGEGAGEAMLVAVEASASVPPAGAEPNAAPVGGIELRLFANRGAGWFEPTPPLPLPDGLDRLHVAEVGGRAYVLIESQADPNGPARLMAGGAEGWRRIDDPAVVPRTWPAGMVGVRDRLLIVHRRAASGPTGRDANAPRVADATGEDANTADLARDANVRGSADGAGATAGWWLTVYRPAGGGTVSQPILSAGAQPLPLGGDLRPLVARLGDRAVLLWRGDEALKMTAVSVAGRYDAIREVTILGTEPQESHAEEVFSYLLIGVLIGVGVPLFLLPGRMPRTAFALPEPVRPTGLLKRVAAGMIDLLPCLALAGAVFPVEPPPGGGGLPWSTDVELTTQQALMVATCLGLYVVYGFLMELAYGATLGKLALGIRVVAVGAQRADLRECALRNVTKILEMAPPLTVMLVLFPLLTPWRQRFGDMLAGTAVVESASLRLYGALRLEDEKLADGVPPAPQEMRRPKSDDAPDDDRAKGRDEDADGGPERGDGSDE